ncbi:MAG: protein kinase family protein, partial [Candidatus Eremiobacteraeota bacterium]|nr:protein kinase family protein [Candidatus Eremiobacteraeota bacterium]
MAEEPIDATLFQAADEQLELRELSRDVDYKIPGVRLEALMGAGTFGEVWSGIQERTGQKVAVKIFTRPFGLDWEYFRQEIERLRDVAEHPNIVTLLDADLNHEPAYLVMPLLTGGSLGDKSPEERTPEQVVSWFYQIAEALNFIHQKGMLHCDLKPSNV